MALLLHKLPDPRWAGFAGEVTAEGARPIEHDDLARIAAQWETTPHASDDVARLLTISRSLFVQSWWCYEFMQVAVTWSLLAVEAALRARFSSPGGRRTWASMVKELRTTKELEVADLDLLDAARRLRNSFAHPETQTALTIGLAAPMIGRSHELVNRIFSS